MSKYVFVTGGVLSGLGKGITTASIAKILQSMGYRVTTVKMDPYINIDAGTMNPFQHGEVWVTEDGGEIDLDLGHYERFLDINIPKDQNITTGQVYREVIQEERRGDYLGQTVQIIPHITDKIKQKIRDVAIKTGVDVLVVEIGGTVGDIESMPFLEALRQLRLEEGPENVFFVHVTLVPVLNVVGEQKTKPTQHSVRELREAGIDPDMIVCRAVEPLTPEAKGKISMFCNLEERAVISEADVSNIYKVPLLLEEEGVGDLITERLALEKRKPDFSEWKKIVEQMETAEEMEKVTIAMVGKYIGLRDSYISITEALKHAAAVLGCGIQIKWVSSDNISYDMVGEQVAEADGILVPYGFGSRGAEGKINVIRYARENRVPFLGICFGFQLATIEFARNVLGIRNANSVEIDPDTPNPVIDLLPEQKLVKEKGGSMRLGAHPIKLEPGTIAYKIYGGNYRISERHRHRYEVNPDYIQQFEKHGLKFSGRSLDGRRMEILEIKDHPCFIATQFHPEYKSRPGKPSPIFLHFVKASKEHKNRKNKAKKGGD
ncbi:MAG: CTP synthetase [Methanobacteriota archaeon]|nr:MAG: CTP synthetase [Euryarchaeota archaeon]